MVARKSGHVVAVAALSGKLNLNSYSLVFRFYFNIKEMTNECMTHGYAIINGFFFNFHNKNCTYKRDFYLIKKMYFFRKLLIF